MTATPADLRLVKVMPNGCEATLSEEFYYACAMTKSGEKRKGNGLNTHFSERSSSC